MGLYIARRVLAAIPVLLGVSLLVFSILHLTPGDPALIMLGNQADITPQDIARVRHEEGLDKPIVIQYLSFLRDAASGNLGRSIYTHQTVDSELTLRLPYTLELTLAALAFSITAGIVLGVLAAVHVHSLSDTLTMIVALLGVSMPDFWLGLLLLYFFALKLGWFPATGQGGLGVNYLVLPALTLGLVTMAITARLTRSSMLEVLNQEYVMTARAKGLKDRTVVIRHALRNALIPVVTIIGLQFGSLLAGTVIVETVFARLGIGQLLVTSVLQKDIPVVQGLVLFVATIYVLVNLAVDVSYTFLDPRIKVH